MWALLVRLSVGSLLATAALGWCQPTTFKRPVADAGIWRERRAGSAPGISGFEPPRSLAPLVRFVAPSVVNVSVRNEGGTRSLGSGFVINERGLIVTNAHVIERAQKIVVRTSDGHEFQATVLGRDMATDLALLSGNAGRGLSPAILADSDRLETGDFVVAIGSPLGLDMSVTHGLISARERVLGVGPYDDFIQTNALINPGKSGGPLFDMNGEVVGVATAIASRGQGIGFAVPVNLLKDLLPNLIDNGRVDRGWLGVNAGDIDDGQKGTVVVTEVYSNGPAAMAGLKAGDRILGMREKPVERYQQLLRRIALLAPGTRIKLEILRDGRPIVVSVVLAERPARHDPSADGASNQ
jgi:serine protease Do